MSWPGGRGGDGVPRSLPIEWVVAECAGALGDRFRYAARAGAEALAGIDRGIAFVFHNSGTPRIALERLVTLVRDEDPDGRLTFTLFPIGGSARLLARPEFAAVYREYGLVLWVRGGQAVSFTPVLGTADEVWAANTRGLLSEG
jgi:hypothetical protein